MFLAALPVDFAKIKQSSRNIRLETLKPLGKVSTPILDFCKFHNLFRCLIKGSIQRIKR